MGTYVVTTAADSGSGSLREAMLAANDNPDSTIQFNIDGGGEKNIYPASPLPDLLVKTTVDATTQPGYNGDKPLIRVDGQFAGPAASFVARGPESLIQALCFTQWSAAGLVLNGSADARVFGCHVGTDQGGVMRRSNGTNGIAVHNSPRAIIGAAGDGFRNVVSGNTLYGILISGPESDGTMVQGNYVGTDMFGLAACKNMRSGVLVFNSPRVTVGSYNPDYKNVISGNERAGVNIDGSVPPADMPHEWQGVGHCHDNVVVGNFIGVDKTGKSALPNVLRGVLLNYCQDTIVGGAGNARNVIAGNLEHGVLIQSPASQSDWNQVARGNKVLGNLIGRGLDNTQIGNAGNGVQIINGYGNIIGTPASPNIIAFNDGLGIRIIGLTATSNTYGNNTVYSNLPPQIVCASS